MKALFLHPNFPAQYRHIITTLGADPNNQIVFGTKTNVLNGVFPELKKPYLILVENPVQTPINMSGF